MPRSSRSRRSGRRNSRGRGRPETVALALLGVCLVVSPQLLGGAYGWAIATIAGLAAVACLAAAWAARNGGTSVRFDQTSWMIFAALAWTAVQALPLPRALTEWLQPSAAEMSDATAGLLGVQPPSFIPLSLSPGATRAQIVHGSAILASFAAAWIAVSMGHRRRVGQLVALSTAVMALVALAHRAAGAERVFGVYEQVYTASPLLAPLLNPNHLSGFLAMGVPLLVGLGLDEQERGRRAGYLVVAALVGATALLSTSRGGVAGLVCGLLALGLLGLARRRSRARDLGTTTALIGAAGAAAAGLGLYVGAEALFREFEAGYGKLELGLSGLALAVDHPFVGVGRGAFSAAFVREHGHEVRATHPESLPAQWLSEWGIVFGAALVAMLAWACVRALASGRGMGRLGAGAALVAIVVHDLVDFALEMAGVAVVAAALLASLVAPRSRGSSASAGTAGWRPAMAAGGLALACVATLGVHIDAQSVFGLQSRLEGQLATDRDGFRETLSRAVALHPSEPAFVLLAGAEAARRGDRAGLAWLNHAMVMAPGWSAPHVETAHYLARRGRVSQALLELREAEERQRTSSLGLTTALVGGRPGVADELIRIARRRPFGLEWLEEVGARLPADDPATVRIDRHLARRGVVPARVRQAQRALDGGEPRAALELLEPDRDRRDTRLQLTRARALLALGEPARAARLLERAEAWTDLVGPVQALLAEAQARAGDSEGMQRTFDRIRGRAAGHPDELAEAWVLQGRLEESMGNFGRALVAYERSHRLEPTAGGLRYAAAAAERVGDLGRSYRAYADLCRLEGPGGASCAARDRVRERMAEPRSLAAQP